MSGRCRRICGSRSSTVSATRCGASAGSRRRSSCPTTIRAIARRREEDAIRAEEYEHYRDAVSRLTPKDRALIVARIEMQWSLAEIAHRYGMPTVDAARMAVNRAVKRLSTDFAARGNKTEQDQTADLEQDAELGRMHVMCSGLCICASAFGSSRVRSPV